MPFYGFHKTTLLHAIALSREEKTYSFLFDVIDQEDERTAGAAIKALAIYNYNEELSNAVSHRVKARKSAALEEIYQKHWDEQKSTE